MVTIVIDPGHYDLYNPGVCEGYYEGNAMLILADYLTEALTIMGANIVLTRSSGSENPTVAERGSMAAGSDLFISLHSDASENSNIRGVTSYFSVQRPQSEPFASAIGMAVANVMGNNFRGSISRPSQTNPDVDYLGVLRAAVATGVPYAFLIENGFHTNMQDCVFLSDNSNLWLIANAIAQVIADYLNLNTRRSCYMRYTVQPGEYLYIIGQKFGVSWQSIAAVNNISPPYVIVPGKQIIIPFPPEMCK